jgi:hypothetical protein
MGRFSIEFGEISKDTEIMTIKFRAEGVANLQKQFSCFPLRLKRTTAVKV